MDKEQNDRGFVTAVRSAFPGRLHSSYLVTLMCLLVQQSTRMDEYMLVLPKERSCGKQSTH